ncbi:DUF4291 domain-containing protein [Streptomyces alkaliterrae]|uniref:DUF4291 domain-containing protein n=1 Tax=Streptomyces alkaliterrae TaxID=2213162 RepID=A0A5P0YUA5_9ACTN|nr:DUF4291 domain-containing protein [Streptomyces alkaliterrae]MBB1261554.1 DUF4291 domain-containing protein [Streptomyces alkaliterrae]MQS03891.1 DUF4291 family protein [Streptomyces alkaliterrae]
MTDTHLGGGEPKYRVRAVHSAETVTVYQAYGPRIGLPAARDGRFPAAWKRERMTWIKPSFLWMMYRCGWGTKSDQETVLALTITRAGFEWAIRNACLTHYSPAVHESRETWREALRTAPARVQWDPERDLRLRPLEHRSLQLGLSGEAARRFADEWITDIRDVTPLASRVRGLVRAGDLATAASLLPEESPYPAPPGLLSHLVPRVNSSGSEAA